MIIYKVAPRAVLGDEEDEGNEMSLMFYERQSVRVKQRDMFATQRAIGAHQYSLT